MAMPGPRQLKRPAYRGGVEKCRHCNSRRSITTRGLCWTCFRLPGVRELFPLLSDGRQARRAGNAYPERHSGLPLPAEACDVLPSEEEYVDYDGGREGRVRGWQSRKVAILAARVLAGEQLFHPLDRRDKD